MMKKVSLLLGLCLLSHLIVLPSFAGDVKRVYFKSIDDIEIEGFFHLPKAPKGLIIMVGGSGPSNGGFGGPTLFAEAFLDKGYASFEWNKRGIRTNDEYSDVSLDKNTYSTNSLDNIILDAEAAFLYAVNTYPDLPIFVVGGSEGSLVASVLAQKYPNQITAGATFGTVVESFIAYVTQQLTDPTWVALLKYDTDDSNSLSKEEYSKALEGLPDLNALFTQLNISFNDIDFLKDQSIRMIEVQKVLTEGIIVNSPGYMLESSGLPDSYFPSIFRLEPLYNRIHDITIPFAFFHGNEDWNTPVKYLVKLEILVKTFGLENFEFNYYPGLGHGPSREMFDDIVKFLEGNI
jgi:alpha-beta hydrolase superfamily lysophospholipase